MPPDKFEQITWEDWENSYWIETISMFETLLFVKVHKLPEPIANPKRATEKHKEYMSTPYTKGEDGFVYIQLRDKFTGETYLEPIYTLQSKP